MRETLRAEIEGFMDDHCARTGGKRIWKTPLVRFADANHPRIAELRRIAFADHFMPSDFLPGATTVVSYFLPFVDEVPASNVDGRAASPAWAEAYLRTNAMAAELNPHLAAALAGMGHRAAVPENIGFSVEALMSRWSQRHVAWLAGHGTFGLNNMLISESGCCGRYFSIVADMPIAHDDICTEERCLFKARGVCRVCARRCVASALRDDGFDRRACWDVCCENAAIHQHPEALVCGKCDVGLPCSSRIPKALERR